MMVVYLELKLLMKYNTIQLQQNFAENIFKYSFC